MNDVIIFTKKNEEKYIQDLKELLRIDSISTNSKGILKCVSHLSDELKELGFETQVLATQGNPIIIANRKGLINKTLLLYGHYDVQPPDPLSLWIEPPFSANEVDGKIYARGAVDDKGNFYCILKAIESYIKSKGTLPCNIRLILEGEEEIGSPSLPAFFEEHKKELSCDDMVWFDGGIHADGRPELCLGMKGMVYVEVTVKSNPRDYHSGKAPLVENAAWKLVEALASIRDRNGYVLIPRFYDKVKKPSTKDIELINYSKLTKEDLLEDWKLDRLNKQSEELNPEQLLTKLYFEPTCTICGMVSGYTGIGSKTVLPAEAKAKIDFRLVPDQDPQEITKLILDHFSGLGINGLSVEVHNGMRASKSPSEAKVVEILANVLERNFGKKPVIKPIVEGSGPGYVFEGLGVPYAFSRLGPNEDRAHSPNEYTTRQAFIKGIITVIELLNEYSKQK